MVDICRRVAARGQLPKTDTRHTRLACMETEAGTAEGIRCAAPGESQAPGCLSYLGGEGTKRRPNRVCAFVEDPKTGCVRHAGSAPYKAAGSLSSVDRESTHAVSGGKPIVARTL